MEPESPIRAAIKTEFWPRLIRELSTVKARETLSDSKLRSTDPPAIFVPKDDPTSALQQQYYANAQENVEVLPGIEAFRDDFYIQKISQRPGLLALEFVNNEPLRYLVPGGRFNEFYGWDSYFIARGLLNDDEHELAAAIADQFAFEIRNYGKILNANRPYYLGRTQPPFLTDLSWRLLKSQPNRIDDFVQWIKAAVREHDEVWAAAPRLDPSTNLFRYHAQGFGIPPETEPGHFDAVLAPFASQRGLSIAEFTNQYNSRVIREPALDEYLLHDRSLRESGHDVTTRFVNCCADLVTIDLACLLYKYETDIARAVATFPDQFAGVKPAEWWQQRAEQTRAAANRYLWNPKLGLFCDYNSREQRSHHPVISATTFWALWSGLATDEQAASIRANALQALEFAGGLSSTSKLPSNMEPKVARQWDYPCGWAPHQILAWEGLSRYGFKSDAQRLARKWMTTITQGARQTSGALYEKYAVNGVNNPQDVNAEYGNQGSKETGFGWTNTSFALAYDHYR